MDIASTLKELRQLRGLTQKALADRLGVSKAQISQVETGYYVPSLQVIQSILGELEAHLLIELDEGGMFAGNSGPDHPPATETR